MQKVGVHTIACVVDASTSGAGEGASSLGTAFAGLCSEACDALPLLPDVRRYAIYSMKTSLILELSRHEPTVRTTGPKTSAEPIYT